MSASFKDAERRCSCRQRTRGGNCCAAAAAVAVADEAVSAAWELALSATAGATWSILSWNSAVCAAGSGSKLA